MKEYKKHDSSLYEEYRIAKMQIWSRVLGIAISVCFLAISFIDEFSTDGGFLTPVQSAAVAAAGVLIGIAVERAGDIWANFVEQNRQREERSRVTNEISNIAKSMQADVAKLTGTVQESYNVQCIGSSPKKVIQHISELSSVASKIRNTFVNIHDSDQDSSEVVSIYNHFLKNGGSWYDIVSINEFFSSRYQKILSDDDAQNFIQSTNTKHPHHEIVVLKHSLPIVNFAIFEFSESRSSEVLFGWAGGRQHGNSLIFRTSDKQMVSMFEKIFMSMWENKRMSHIVVDYLVSGRHRYSSKTTLVVVDKIGYWYTHGYVRCKDNLFQRKTTALYKIEFVGGKPVIEGFVADGSSDKNLRVFSHRNPELIQHSESRIFIEFAGMKNALLNEGFVFYSFKRVLEEDVITGFAIDNYYNDKLYIIGTRVELSSQTIKPESLKEIHQSNLSKVERIWNDEMGIDASD